MRNTVLLLLFILTFTSCKKNGEQVAESKKETIEPEVKIIKNSSKKDSQVIPDFIDISKIPDSLELVTTKTLKGDFNGDNKTDFASLVKNKKSNQIGVIIIHNTDNQDFFVFGAGKEVDNMTDLNWIGVFKLLPKGEIVAPNFLDQETGDILEPDENQNFKLIGNGIFMKIEESHGGGILFWDGKNYKWYHLA